MTSTAASIRQLPSVGEMGAPRCAGRARSRRLSRDVWTRPRRAGTRPERAVDAVAQPVEPDCSGQVERGRGPRLALTWIAEQLARTGVDRLDVVVGDSRPRRRSAAAAASSRPVRSRVAPSAGTGPGSGGLGPLRAPTGSATRNGRRCGSDGRQDPFGAVRGGRSSGAGPRARRVASGASSRPCREQVAGVAQREGEQLERSPLELGREVDQDVAAEDQVDPREGARCAEIVLAEDDQRRIALLDLVVAVDAG